MAKEMCIVRVLKPFSCLTSIAEYLWKKTLFYLSFHLPSIFSPITAGCVSKLDILFKPNEGDIFL